MIPYQIVTDKDLWIVELKVVRQTVQEIVRELVQEMEMETLVLQETEVLKDPFMIMPR